MPDCVFCNLNLDINFIVYENDLLYVIFDIRPLSYGHLLIIPRKHCGYLHELGDEELGVILPLIKKIVKSCGYEKYNILQNNYHIQSVPHVHFHIIPYNNSDDCLKIVWDVIDVENEELKKLAKKIKSKINQ